MKDPANLARVRWAHDVGAADWIIDVLHKHPRRGAWDVGAFVPSSFDAFARVLHPAWEAWNPRPAKIRWGELARAQASELTAGTDFDDLSDHPSASNVVAPLKGTLDCDDLDALLDLLAGSTAQPERCWFGLWDGWASLEDLPPGPRVEVPDRSFALYSGPLEGALTFCHPPVSQSPNLLWPADRAWCVASEVDFRSTYVGGSNRLIDQILSDEQLEAIPVRPGDRITD